MQDRILDIATRFPKLVFLSVLALVLAAGSQLPRIIVDTDPDGRETHPKLRKEGGVGGF